MSALNRITRPELLILLVLPLVLLLLASWLLCGMKLDLEMCRVFFGGEHLSWPYLDGWPSIVVNHVAVYPTYLLGCGGLIVAVLGSCRARFRPWTRDGLFLALLLALGPGVLINGIMKPLWGRPRPEETSAFKGPLQYRPIWQVDLQSTSKSFPSGHAGAGFYMIAPAFLLYRRNRGLAIGLGMVGVAYGTAVGLTRMMQGQHFPSDILWSAAIVYFLGLFLYAACDVGRNYQQRREATSLFGQRPASPVSIRESAVLR